MNVDPQLFWAFFGRVVGWALVVAYVISFLVRLWYSFQPKWWTRQNHTWYSRVSCAAGIHWRGSSGNSCLHNITVCHRCGEDVCWVVKDEAQ